ncbi:hypothetical protein RHM66_10465 [Pseudomonas sp. RTB3]|nr:hypothetical protein RHM66_10465 [Pseudomonas sp. RTB3]
MNDLVLTDSETLLTQLTTHPSLREVASIVLKTALHELYPTLDIDPNLAIVRTPRWTVVNGELIPQKPFGETLTGAGGIDFFATQTPTLLPTHNLNTQATGAVISPSKIDNIRSPITVFYPTRCRSGGARESLQGNALNRDARVIVNVLSRASSLLR